MEQLLQEISHKLDKLDKLDKLEEKIDVVLKFIKRTDARLLTLEGSSKNLNSATERELTQGIKRSLEDYATRHGLKRTIMTGKSFPRNLRSPTDSTQLITEMDGCYILSNDESNADLEDFIKSSNSIMDVNSRIKLTQYALKNLKSNSYTRSVKLNELKKLLKHEKYPFDSKKHLEGISKQLRDIHDNIRVMSLEAKRYIVIVEAKNPLGKENVEQQQSKMRDLIEYFCTINYYYYAKERDMLERVSKMEKWGDHFLSLCERFNLKFNGVILVIGGPNYRKDIEDIFGQIKGNIVKDYLNGINSATELMNETDEDDAYAYHKVRAEYEYKMKLHIDTILYTPQGTEYMRTNDRH